MIRSIQDTTTAVPPEEVARRIAEMRQLAWEHRQPAVVVYHTPHHPCPWAGCGYRIAGIRFQLEQMAGYAEDSERWLKSWWLGPGLLARCPNCRSWVLFDVLSKQAVHDPDLLDAPRLPVDWHLKAYVFIRPHASTFP